MMSSPNLPHFDVDDTLYPHWCVRLRQLQFASAMMDMAVMIARYGFQNLASSLANQLAWVMMAALSLPVGIQLLRYLWSRRRPSYVREHRTELSFSAAWLLGVVILPVVSILDVAEMPSTWTLLTSWAELLTLIWGGYELYLAIHAAANAGLNPALVLVVSFMALICIGTVLLMSPRCRPVGQPPAPFRVALFTATSASCVTGLIVEPTGSYWSRTGQTVILGLIQCGGLGIMTFSAFFAYALGQRLPVREQMTFRQLLESDRMGDIGSMIRAILGFTFGIELLGAIVLCTLWPERPFGDRCFYGLFHSVSAFCNAGFGLRDQSLLHWEMKWQVWGAIPLLIILGGFGFTSLDNWRKVITFRCFTRIPFGGTAQTQRLTLNTRISTITTLSLLLVGTVCLYCLERNNPRHPQEEGNQWANAWFHSVTLRTAGFNTVDHQELRPATKLFGMGMMFIGASAGSTGGGVKTICFAITLLTLRSVLRGRPSVECGGRTIPEEQVFRGLAIITMGLATLMLTSLLLVVIEDRPGRLIDQLYEAASAFGTVGLSANLTPQLKPLSQYLLVVTMFLGRVGPLTLIIALAGFTRPGAYAYPEERVSLG
ncbi:Trk family potassium uptake protein [bacterium]|nr:Trk family potassium uptake protein [bacterium]